IATPEDYAVIRRRWQENLIGSNFAATEDGKTSLTEMNRAAQEFWNSYKYKGQAACTDIPWDDAPVGSVIPYRDDAVEFRSAIGHVLAMAKAYQAEGGNLYKNAAMLTDMTHILDWIATECYTPKNQTDNWWTWEIGVPKDLVPALILLHDDLTKEQLEKYCQGLLFFQPDPFWEGAVDTASTHNMGRRENKGANLMDCSTTAIGIGAILEDSEQLYLGQLASESEMVFYDVADSTKISSTGYQSGFYPEGVYIDHNYIPYTGSYGVEYFRGGVTIAALLNNTPWEYTTKTIETLERFVTDGFAPSMYNGLMLDMLKGRSVARKSSSDMAAGRDVMSLMIKLRDAVRPETQATFDTYLKRWMEADTTYIDSLTGATNILLRQKAEEILADAAVSTEIEPIHRNLAFGDRAIHRTAEYLFGLSMYSNRIQNCEVTNGENLYGWHQGDGATYLYNADKAHYTEEYWNTVNPFRLAGTTVVPVNIGNGTADSSGYYQDGDYRSYESWVGGSTLGNYGINGMALSGKNTSSKVSYAKDLSARKSYFMFEDEVVCLGAGITNRGMNLPVETTIENRKLNAAGSNIVMIDGEELDLTLENNKVAEIVNGTADTTGISIPDAHYIHLEGNTETAGIGYYFPHNMEGLSIRKTANTGNWNEIGTTEGESTRNYLELWVDHGKNPVKEAYEYVLLPNMTADTVKNYADAPKITVLENSSAAQGVYSETLHMTGVNFWEDKPYTVKDLTVNKKASVMMQEQVTDGILNIAVSDPTMMNTKTIEVEIAKPGVEVVSQDPNVEVTLEDGKILLTVSV
ncbi:MAG: polysaccharide lyase 8 family protein, partial [Hungatella sp.]